MINLVLECIDRLHVYSSAAHFADVAGKEAGESWKSILNSLYEHLGTNYIPALSITGEICSTERHTLCSQSLTSVLLL